MSCHVSKQVDRMVKKSQMPKAFPIDFLAIRNSAVVVVGTCVCVVVKVFSKKKRNRRFFPVSLVTELLKSWKPSKLKITSIAVPKPICYTGLFLSLSCIKMLSSLNYFLFFHFFSFHFSKFILTEEERERKIRLPLVLT